MSHSSLWVMDKDFIGEEVATFGNSWWFAPVVWDVLLDKYLPRRRMQLFNGEKTGYMVSAMNDNALFGDLNDCINRCGNFADRVLWEMSNQQVFFTRDKRCITDAIKAFVIQNENYYRDRKEEGPLENETIIARFGEVAVAINEVSEADCPYFIFKGTSCDDQVEYWFSEYDEESGDDIPRSLRDLGNYVTEFVLIEKDGRIRFKSNIEYTKGGTEPCTDQ